MLFSGDCARRCILATGAQPVVWNAIMRTVRAGNARHILFEGPFSASAELYVIVSSRRRSGCRVEFTA